MPVFGDSGEYTLIVTRKFEGSTNTQTSTRVIMVALHPCETGVWDKVNFGKEIFNVKGGKSGRIDVPSTLHNHITTCE